MNAPDYALEQSVRGLALAPQTCLKLLRLRPVQCERQPSGNRL